MERQLRAVSRLEQVSNVRYNHDTYYEKGKRKDRKAIFIHTRRCETLYEVRQLINKIRKVLQVPTMTKDFYEDQDLLYKGELEGIRLNVWIPIPKEKALSILSNFFKCEMTKQEEKRSYYSVSVACAKP